VSRAEIWPRMKPTPDIWGGHVGEDPGDQQDLRLAIAHS
jgi:hypothetical protein